MRNWRGCKVEFPELRELHDYKTVTFERLAYWVLADCGEELTAEEVFNGMEQLILPGVDKRDPHALRLNSLLNGGVKAAARALWTVERHGYAAQRQVDSNHCSVRVGGHVTWHEHKKRLWKAIR